MLFVEAAASIFGRIVRRRRSLKRSSRVFGGEPKRTLIGKTTKTPESENSSAFFIGDGVRRESEADERGVRSTRRRRENARRRFETARFEREPTRKNGERSRKELERVEAFAERRGI